MDFLPDIQMMAKIGTITGFAGAVINGVAGYYLMAGLSLLIYLVSFPIIVGWITF